MKTVTVNTFEHIAILRQAGFEFLKTIPGERRVSVVFSDPSGTACETLRQHENGDFRPASCDLFAALSWAKGKVFSAKDKTQ